MKFRKWIKLGIIISLLLTILDHLYSTIQVAIQIGNQIGKPMGRDYFIDRLLGIGSASSYGMSIRFFGTSYSTQMNLYQFLLFRFVSVFMLVGAIILIVTFSRRIFNFIKQKKVI